MTMRSVMDTLKLDQLSFTSELVGTYLISELSSKYGNSIGLYRDDGLAAFNPTNKKIESMKQDIHNIFKKHKLKITIEANKKKINFLDVTLDLNKGTYQPYTKQNNNTQYVHRQSKHPPAILKNIPEAINKRLSNIATVRITDKEETYAGVTATTFKTRYNNHTLSFRSKTYKNNTELSKLIWKLKGNNTEHSITREILQLSKPYINATKRCKGHSRL